MTKEEIISYVNKKDGFIKYNNYFIQELEDDFCKGIIKLSENSLNPAGSAHGGLIFGFADTLMGILASVKHSNVVTISASIDYLKLENGSIIKGVAKPIKIGNKIGFYETKLYNEKDELIAIVSANYYFK